MSNHPNAVSWFSFPTRVAFGAGSKSLIPIELSKAGVKRVLVVTDQGVSRLEWFNQIVASLLSAGMEARVYPGVHGNPTESQVNNGVDAFKDHQAQWIVAVGGGAAMDVAKGIALLADHPGRVHDYRDGDPSAKPIDPARVIPIYAVPTTAGTGSEVGRSGVVSDDETHQKIIFFDPSLLPQKVFADPELTLALPAAVTASTGMDALTHLIEAYLAKGFHPMCDGIALEGIRLVHQGLEKSVAFASSGDQGSEEHLSARSMMLMASMMGAVAFQKGLGLTHSCAHALSSVCDLHHGLANGIMLEPCMKFNLEAVPHKFQMMAQTIGLAQANTMEAADSFVDWIHDLGKQIGIPAKLSAVGVKEEHVDSLIEFAMADVCHPLGPRPVDEEQFRSLFEGML